MDAAPLSFDEGMKCLEAAVQRLEAGSMGLDESLRCFEDGVRLSRDLQGILDRAQRRVEALRRGDGGEYVAEPLDDRTLRGDPPEDEEGPYGPEAEA